MALKVESNRLNAMWKRIKKVILLIVSAFFILSLAIVMLYKYVPVFWTPLMISRSIEFRGDNTFRTEKEWVKIEDISDELIKAVIASEDNLFDEHNGFDWEQIRKAIDDHRNKGKKLRGASTISQQTAKNVFLIPSRSFLRKGFEAYFTVLIELLWSKERIMEVYLNVAEMGKGIYGAQAAAERHFKKEASELSRWESCLIAACLPKPLDRTASSPTAYVVKRARNVNSLISKIEYPEWL